MPAENRTTVGPGERKCLKCGTVDKVYLGAEMTGTSGAKPIVGWVCGACIRDMQQEYVVIRKGQERPDLG